MTDVKEEEEEEPQEKFQESEEEEVDRKGRDFKNTKVEGEDDKGSQRTTQPSTCKVKEELPDIPPEATFATRLPLWIEQCLKFQRDKRTWAPTRPCCFVNQFV